jgi:hypothetical protein
MHQPRVPFFARRGGSPIVDWLRAYGREIFSRNGGKEIGVVGLCLTGNFAIALLADDFTLAPVTAEPSLPFAVTASVRSSMAVTDEDLALPSVPLMALMVTSG